MIKVNGKEINGEYFAYDGCHKIYILEDALDGYECARADYRIRPIERLKETYEDSCELRFISNWKLTKYYVKQFENAEFGE